MIVTDGFLPLTTEHDGLMALAFKQLLGVFLSQD